MKTIDNDNINHESGGLKISSKFKFKFKQLLTKIINYILIFSFTKGLNQILQKLYTSNKKEKLLR